MANWSLQNKTAKEGSKIIAGLGGSSPAPLGRIYLLLFILALFPVQTIAVITFEKTFADAMPYFHFNCWGGVIQTLDGGYLVSNYLFPHPEAGAGMQWVAKCDSLGNIEWTHLYDEGWCSYSGGLALAADSHYVIVGAFDEAHGAQGILDGFVFKVKAHNGTIVWRYIYSGPRWDQFSNVAATPDGGCVAAGRLSDPIIPRAFGLVRLGRDGKVLWERLYPEAHFGGDVLVMPDCGYAVTTGVISNPLRASYEDCWLCVMRLDSLGERLWTRLETTPPDYSYLNGEISLTPEENIAICGLYGGPSNPGDSICGFVKVYNPDGKKLLDKTVGVAVAPQRRFHFFRGGRSTPDGGFIMVGEIIPDSGLNTQMFLFRLDKYGDSVWCRTYGPDTTWDYGWAVINTRDGGYCFTGQQDPIRGNSIYSGGPLCLIKTDSLGMVYTGVEQQRAEPLPNLLLDVSPNPFTKTATIRYQLPSASPVRILAFDITGRPIATIFDQNQPAGTHQLIWQPKGLAQGIYFIKLQLPGSAFTQRCLYLHQE